MLTNQQRFESLIGYLEGLLEDNNVDVVEEAKEIFRILNIPIPKKRLK